MNVDGKTPKGHACTKFCGVYTSRTNRAGVVRFQNYSQVFHCVLCGNAFQSVGGTREHFKLCAERLGNPRGHFFDDHPSIPPKA